MYARGYEAPKQTIHLYVVQEEEYEESYRKPMSVGQRVNRALCLVGMFMLFAIPSGVDGEPWSLSVPVQFLPVQTLSATVAIVPTGTNIVPATNASGYLTVYNGSFLAQQLPKGFLVESSSSAFATDETVTIPAANPPALGVARIPAHAVAAGQAGNIGALAINATYGTSLYLKNLTAFSGGIDARAEQVATNSDKLQALSSARYRLHRRVATRMLNGPCPESVQEQDSSLSVSWACQFVQYRVPPGLHVLSAQRVGDHVILGVQR